MSEQRIERQGEPGASRLRPILMYTAAALVLLGAVWLAASVTSPVDCPAGGEPVPPCITKHQIPLRVVIIVAGLLLAAALAKLARRKASAPWHQG